MIKIFALSLSESSPAEDPTAVCYVGSSKQAYPLSFLASKVRGGSYQNLAPLFEDDKRPHYHLLEEVDESAREAAVKVHKVHKDRLAAAGAQLLNRQDLKAEPFTVSLSAEQQQRLGTLFDRLDIDIEASFGSRLARLLRLVADGQLAIENAK